MKIMMNRSIKDGSPRLLFDYVLKDLEIQMSRAQYHGMLSIQAAWKFLELSRIHRRFRPLHSVKHKPRHWWLYAFRCIKVHFIKPYTWSSIRQHRRRYRHLVELWVKRYKQGKSTSLKQQIKEAENLIDVISIMLAREQAKNEAKKPEPESKTPSPSSNKSKLKSFVTGVIAEKKAAITNNQVFNLFSSTNIEQQLLEICKAMGCSFESDDTIKPRTYIEHVFNFSLQKCQITLESIIRSKVFNFNVCIETRPSAVAYTVAARTESIFVETDSPEPSTIISSNNLVHSQGEVLV